VLNRPTPTTAIDHVEFQMVEHDQGAEADDNWNLAGLNIVTWVEGQRLENCEYNAFAINTNSGTLQDHAFLRMGDRGDVLRPSVYEPANGLTAEFSHQGGSCK
jgi:hypothetical protein